jgi:hypothetical protein
MASVEETLALWAASLREIKQRIRPLFKQERVARNVGLFLEGLLGDEQRKTGWMRAEAAGDPGPWRQQAILGRRDWDADALRDSCLALLHDQAQEVGMVAAGVGDLMALSIMMKDSEDEVRTLNGLRTWLTALSNQLLHAREIVNGTMSQCSNSATVNVKGQTLLNILSEWSDPVSVISKKVAQAAPPKR